MVIGLSKRYLDRNLLVVFAFVFLATAGYGVSKSMKSDAKLSDLALENVEALADGESGDSKGLLYGTAPDENGQCKYCCCPGDNDCSAAGCANC